MSIAINGAGGPTFRVTIDGGVPIEVSSALTGAQAVQFLVPAFEAAIAGVKPVAAPEADEAPASVLAPPPEAEAEPEPKPEGFLKRAMKSMAPGDK